MLVWLAPWFRSCRGRAVVLGLAVGFLRGFDHTRGGVCRRRAGLTAARLARVRRARGVVPLIGSGSGERGPRGGGWILIGYGGWILVGYPGPQRAAGCSLVGGCGAGTAPGGFSR